MESTSTIKEKDSKKSKWPLIISFLIAISLLACYFLWPAFQNSTDNAYAILTSGDKKRISQWVARFGFWGPIIVILGMVAQMFLLVIPSVLLIVVSVLAYGPIWGSIISVAAILAASSVGYVIGAYLGQVAVYKLLDAESENKMETYVNKYGIWAIIIARISPLLSDDAISFVAGLVKMGYWKFMGATLAGILPLIVLIAYLGESYTRLKTGVIWVSIISLIAFILYVSYDRRKQK